MSIFKAIEGPYSEHIGGAFTHPITGAIFFLVTYRANSQGPYRLQVWEDTLPYGDPKIIRDWATGTTESGPGPWGHGTCTWGFDGSLYVAVPGGVDSSAVTPAIHVEPGLFPPYTPAVDLRAIEAEINRLQQIASLQQTRLNEFETALANAGQGGLDAADKKALGWLRGFLGDLVG